MSRRPWSSFPLLALLAALCGPSCSSTSKNPGGSGGAAGGGAAAGSGGGGTGGACCGAAEVPECGCGCPSLFPTGAFNSAVEVSGTGFDCADLKSFVVEDGCGALMLTGSDSQHCAHFPKVQVDAGGKCVSGRIRIRSSTGGSVTLAVDGTSFQPILDENPPQTFGTYSHTCRLPDPFTIGEAYLNVNEGSGDPAATVTIDFVEIFVSTCVGSEPACQ